MKNMFLVKVVLVGLIICTSTVKGVNAKQLQFEEIYKNPLFSEETPNEFVHLKDGKHFTSQLGDGSIVKMSYKHPEDTVMLFNAPAFYATIGRVYTYQFSGNEDKLLLATRKVNKYRHSYVAEYWVYHPKEKVLQQVSVHKLQMAKLSPDGTQVAYVYDNNMYVKQLDSDKVQPITTDGELNKVINGMPDWVYEEEFTLTSAFFWSPDSRHIAFYRFDESQVKEFSFDTYTTEYPTLYTYKYPKAGEENARVSIFVYNTENGSLQPVPVSENDDSYIPTICWNTTGDLLCISHLNRLQNDLTLIGYQTESKTTKTLYSEQEEKYFADITEGYMQFISDKAYIVCGEKDAYRHLYLGNTEKQSLIPITKGAWDVAEFIGLDKKTNKIYYTAHEASVFEKQLYSISLDGASKKRITQEKGTHEIEFSSDFSFYIDTYSSADKPTNSLIRTKQGKITGTIVDNKALNEQIKEHAFVAREFFSFTNRDDVSLNGYLYKPKDFKSTKAYPVLIYVYGGPESQKVVEEWSYMNLWFQYLVQEGYLVACVDNRGTDGRGEEFRKATYLQLGIQEASDQVDAAKFLAALPYTDENRIGIFGWSYGGFMALQCMIHGSDVFKTAVAVAPVSDWRFYDSVYTERFMRTPSENKSGYDSTSIIKHAAGISKKVLIVHGLSDDNVHPQNTMMLLRELVKENIPYDSEVYVRKNHSINGENTRIHLFGKITNHLLEEL